MPYEAAQRVEIAVSAIETVSFSHGLLHNPIFQAMFVVPAKHIFDGSARDDGAV